MGYIDDLTEFGLTRQEATIYYELLKANGMTGYEVAKTTGISKSNVYTALNGLVTKGAARQEECEAVRYVGVPAEEFCTNHIKILTGVRKRLVEEQPIKKKEQEGYIQFSLLFISAIRYRACLSVAKKDSILWRTA